MNSLRILLTAAVCASVVTGCTHLPLPAEAELCHYDGAYAVGMNDARHSSEMRPGRLTEACPDTAAGDVLAGYREGYTAGAAAFGATERPTAANSASQARDTRRARRSERRRYESPSSPSYSPSLGTQLPCASQNDCDEGWCRDRGDGMKVCMHNGRAGDACRSGNDCSGGLFCKDPGNGLKACM